MKTIISLILVVFSINTHSQIKISYALWNDTILENQKEYWSEGGIRFENIKDNDGKMIRKEYDRNGSVKKTCEIQQDYSIDTVYIRNPNSGKIKAIVKNGYMDTPNGLYTEYYPGSTNKKIEGILIKDTKIEIWTQWDKSGKILFTKNYSEQ